MNSVESVAELQQELRRVPLLADLQPQHLQWIAEHSDEMRFEAGAHAIRNGDAADAMFILLEGEIEGRADGHVTFVARAGEITGKLPHSRLKNYPRGVRAVTPVRLLRVMETSFGEMLDVIPELEVRLVQLMADRIRDFTANEVQQSKLAALGKLSAGLAHELNNPASAAGRAADSIKTKLEQLRGFDCTMATAELTSAQRAKIVSIENSAIEHARTCTALDTLTRSDREEEIGVELSAMGVSEAWDLAPELIDAGFTPERLQELHADSDGVFADVLARIAVLIALERLAQEVKESACRISGLVKSIKEYSYMDKTNEREVDVHKDIENTLSIVGSKISKAGVTIDRQYDKSLPVICANGSELNQVWTNLIDNAVDAMASMTSGVRVLTLKTGRKLDRVVVEVSDTGPGIPADIRGRIFEPFFTTKKQGEGTGLGLDAVQRIVRRHRGEIVVESKPGRTCFQVTLPVKGSAAASD